MWKAVQNAIYKNKEAFFISTSLLARNNVAGILGGYPGYWGGWGGMAPSLKVFLKCSPIRNMISNGVFHCSMTYFIWQASLRLGFQKERNEPGWSDPPGSFSTQIPRAWAWITKGNLGIRIFNTPCLSPHGSDGRPPRSGIADCTPPHATTLKVL